MLRELFGSLGLHAIHFVSCSKLFVSQQQQVQQYSSPISTVFLSSKLLGSMADAVDTGHKNLEGLVMAAMAWASWPAPLGRLWYANPHRLAASDIAPVFGREWEPTVWTQPSLKLSLHTP